MAYDEKYKRPEINHSLILENRKKLAVSGVTEVESFNEDEIIMYTSSGDITIQGTGLHITKLSLDSGDINIDGEIDAVKYDTPQVSKGGFLSRLFK